MALFLFPARVPIGTVAQDGRVLATPEFIRALGELMQRVGGVFGDQGTDTFADASGFGQGMFQGMEGMPETMQRPAVDIDTIMLLQQAGIILELPELPWQPAPQQAQIQPDVMQSAGFDSIPPDVVQPTSVAQMDGIWTPTILGSTTAGAQTYSNQSGRWTRFGRLVLLEFAIVMTAKDAATAGNMQIGGLPFTPAFGLAGASIAYYSNVDLSAGKTQFGIATDMGSPTMTCFESGDNVAAAFLGAAAIGAATAIVGSITFTV